MAKTKWVDSDFLLDGEQRGLIWRLASGDYQAVVYPRWKLRWDRPVQELAYNVTEAEAKAAVEKYWAYITEKHWADITHRTP